MNEEKPQRQSEASSCRDKCQSCGKMFTEHMGIIGTCAELQRVKAENALLKANNALLRIALANITSTAQEVKDSNTPEFMEWLGQRCLEAEAVYDGTGGE